MNKRSEVGQVYVGIQNELIDQLKGTSIWSKYYRRWKSRFLGVMNTMIIMRITNDGKDNVPSKGLIILSRIKSFKDVWFWNMT